MVVVWAKIIIFTKKLIVRLGEYREIVNLVTFVPFKRVDLFLAVRDKILDTNDIDANH